MLLNSLPCRRRKRLAHEVFDTLATHSGLRSLESRESQCQMSFNGEKCHRLVTRSQKSDGSEVSMRVLFFLRIVSNFNILMLVTHNKEKEQDHHQLPQLKTKPQELPGLQLTENICWEKHVGATTAKANKVSDFVYMNPKGR